MKKCLVLDLDNTLWGGIIGEDGMDGIALSVTAPGNSFISFQQAILDCYNRGTLLAINSRNNPDEALRVLRSHPNMILKENHFAAMRINWDDKAENLKEIAEELNIGLDSFVFLDDDPTNRAWVRTALPEVEVPELPQDPAHYTKFFLSLPYFEGGEVTDEDKMRGNMYVTERLRREEEKKFTDREAFLKSLGLKLTIFKDDTSCLPRLAQLTEKTNQFNTNKHPYSEAEMAAFMESKDHSVWHARLSDRFGDYGVILVAIVSTVAHAWMITSFLMSCRVFDRGVEDTVLAAILADAKKAGQTSVSIEFTETPKNQPAADFVVSRFSDKEIKVTNGVFPPWLEILYG